MKHLCKTLFFVAFVVLLTAGPAFTQSPTTEIAASSTAPVAYAYVQTHQGVDVYGVSSAGGLTLVKGSPFATIGQMEAVSGKYLISVGTNLIFTYPLESNGAIGRQASSINTQNYAGSECGSTSNNGYANGSVLDRTGKYLYMLMYDGYNTDCAAWQSYAIGSNGSFTFLGSMEDEAYSSGNPQPSTLPTMSSSDSFGYATIVGGGGCNSYSPYAKNSTGELEKNTSFSSADPHGNPNGAPWYACPLNIRADQSGHLAVLMYFEDDPPYGNYSQKQLASYTISNNGTGAISSQNTWSNMPTIGLTNVNALTPMSMSPSGKLLVLADGTAGIQIFHFNGASPVTSYSKVLVPTVKIDQLAWDKENHLFALSYETGQLYEYTVTPTAINPVSAAPYKIKNAYGVNGLIVVPKA